MLEHVIDGAIVALQLKHIALALAGAVLGSFFVRFRVFPPRSVSLCWFL